MKYQKPINNVNSNDEFSSGLMEAYGKWMGGDTFQNTQPVELQLSEAPFDGMDRQSHGAEIEDTTKKEKKAKKGGYIGQESAPKNEEVEVLEREEYEVDGETYVIEKVKGLDGKACWKGYKYAGTKMKGGKKVDDCVKAGFEPEGDELTEGKEKCPKCMGEGCKHCGDTGYHTEAAEALWSTVGKALSELGEMDGVKFKVIGEKKLDPVNHKELKGDHADRKDKDIDNDGDVDKSDKYLHMRRKKVSKIIGMSKKK